jgi:phosphopantothenoylcysteine decarboxylase/phosphopantothenate--cysteine ligase
MANILIGITGSVAAFKVVPLIRDLTKHGHNVKVILTNDGMKFISDQLIAAIGVEVYNDTLIDYTNPKQAMLHIDLAKFAELFMILPASANTIAKLAHGIADSLLAQAVLVYDGVKPIIVVPAMNQAMWKNSITQSNIEIVRISRVVYTF